MAGIVEWWETEGSDAPAAAYHRGLGGDNEIFGFCCSERLGAFQLVHGAFRVESFFRR